MKKIYLVVQKHRVKGSSEGWQSKEPIYAVKTMEEATEDCKHLNKMKKAKNEFLEFKYSMEEIDLM